MKASFLIRFPAVFVLALSAHGTPMLPSGATGKAEPVVVAPGEVVALFRSAVARGELVVFGKTLDLSMIRPSRVEYVFDLVHNRSAVKVYSELVTPLDSPNLNNCRAHGVSAIITLDGRIIETEVHVWPSKQ